MKEIIIAVIFTFGVLLSGSGCKGSPCEELSDLCGEVTIDENCPIALCQADCYQASETEDIDLPLCLLVCEGDPTIDSYKELCRCRCREIAGDSDEDTCVEMIGEIESGIFDIL